METTNYVLILDDNQEFCERLKAILANEGIKAEYFAKAEPGIAYFKTSPASVVLLDVRYVREGDPTSGNKETGVWVFMELRDIIKKQCLQTRVHVMSGDPEAIAYPTEILGLDKEFFDIVPIDKDRLTKEKVLEFVRKQFGVASMATNIDDPTSHFKSVHSRLGIVDARLGIIAGKNYQEALENQIKNPDTCIAKLRNVVECVTEEMCKFESRGYVPNTLELSNRIDLLLGNKILVGFNATTGTEIKKIFEGVDFSTIKKTGNKATHLSAKVEAPNPAHSLDALLKTTQLLECFLAWFQKTFSRQSGRISADGIKTKLGGGFSNQARIVYGDGKSAMLHRDMWIDATRKFHELNPMKKLSLSSTMSSEANRLLG